MGAVAMIMPLRRHPLRREPRRQPRGTLLLGVVPDRLISSRGDRSQYSSTIIHGVLGINSKLELSLPWSPQFPTRIIVVLMSSQPCRKVGCDSSADRT